MKPTPLHGGSTTTSRNARASLSTARTSDRRHAPSLRLRGEVERAAPPCHQSQRGAIFEATNAARGAPRDGGDDVQDEQRSAARRPAQIPQRRGRSLFVLDI